MNKVAGGDCVYLSLISYNEVLAVVERAVHFLQITRDL